MQNFFQDAYENLTWFVSNHLPTTVLIILLGVLVLYLIWSLGRSRRVDLAHARAPRTDRTRRQHGLDLVQQGEAQIRDAERMRQDAATLRPTDPAAAADLQRSAAQLMDDGQRDVDEGHRILDANPESYPRQWGAAGILAALILLVLILMVAYVGWIGREPNGPSSADAARATKNLVAKAEKVYAPGYSILVDGSRFELHLPFGGLPPAQQMEWMAAINQSITEWNAANPYKERKFVGAESASLVGYTKDGKLQGVLLTFKVKEWKCNEYVEKDLNFVHPLRAMGPHAVIRTADSLAQKLDTLAAGGGTPGGIPGMGPLQEAAPQF
jgi:hypothetical protein